VSNHIDYFFTSISPFSYLGHTALTEIAAKHGKAIVFRPFNLFEVWENSGAVPPAQRAAVRQRYRMVELRRVALFRDVCLNPKPKHFPTDPTLADQVICVLQDTDQNPGEMAKLVGRAVWEKDLNVADEQVIAELLRESGHDADAVMNEAKSGKGTSLRGENTKAAVEADAVGAPAYVYEEEVFWGQDRLEYLDQMITSGRNSIL